MYLGQTFVHSEYQRDGFYRNGLYAYNSFGKSDTVILDNFGFKGGAIYKLSGRKFLNFNGLYMTKAPSLRNIFPNARLNNNIINKLENENIASADMSYIFRNPRFNSRITAYYSKVKNATETSFLFAEGLFADVNGDGGDAYVGEIITGIAKKNIGIEIGLEYQITPSIKLSAAIDYGEFRYDNNPNIQIIDDSKATVDNTYPVSDLGSSYLKNYRIAGTPQSAVSFGIEYRDPKFWWVGSNYNYLDNSYLDIAPILRTNRFVTNPADINGQPFPEATNERVRELLQQEKFAGIHLVNLIGGKSWRVGGNTLGFFASINNIFDFTYKTGGYQQARNSNYRELNQDVSSGTPSFAPKYFYGYGRTYFLNIYINF